MFDEVIGLLSGMPLVLRALVVGLLPALMTALGTLPVFLGIRLSKRFINSGMGFAAGVMLVASFTSLLMPAVEEGGIVTAISGFIVGVAMIKALDLLIPHEHTPCGSEEDVASTAFRRAQLMILAMVVHNIPEGMAVGAATVYDVTEGLALATAIGLQDIPEGLAVALPVLAITGRAGFAFIMGTLSGIAEALAAMLPALMVAYARATLPFVLSLASGAMIYVVVHEVIPGIYGYAQDELVTIGFFVGFLAMLILDSLMV